MGVIREDPRESKLHIRDINWEQVHTEVSDLNGEFGMVGIFSPSQATWLRDGKCRAFLPEGMQTGTDEAAAFMEQRYEITTRSVSRKPDKAKIYIRRISEGA